ncbi:uncharacterized protein E0L32_004353 [Thyridium curvatum]|uniref:CCAAT-binding factor domain-containing protein n=1 Tax=Thyridium curvatum TaxID=1093900 RepID=A0A507AXZ7_9PEZI|nr:uncharacterized protein E0L32_004353 [Thyridium curvatum]TPX15655.1 hypothetical protein E0L32_004353 [Thyridium curvatum]
MPSAVAGESVKRKRKGTAEAPRKRARSESSDEGEDLQGRILLLESEIVESKKHYNNIATLIGIAQDSSKEGAEASVVACVSLCRVFIRLLSSGNLIKKKGLSEKDLVVVQWLKDRLADYKQLLLELLDQDEAASTALTLCMRLLKAEAQYSTDKAEYSFPRQFLRNIVNKVMVQQKSIDGLLKDFIETYVNQFDDVRFYTFQAIAEMLDEVSDKTLTSEQFENVFTFLSSVEGVPNSNGEIEEFYVEAPKKKSHPLYLASQHKKQAQDAWLALLNLNLSKDQRKKLLDVMSQVIAPCFTKPELLMDFLTDCYNTGGSMSLLALSGVFYLIQERNLDYPSFYAKLYSLLDADILHSKHRSRFFRLLDTFLASSHLPAQLVASFIKRLARLCLNGPPSAVVAIVPWFYNLFKKHPTCTFMLHRVPRTKEEQKQYDAEGMEDPYLPDESDPMETQAIDSCLWEIVQLQSHYHPNVATIAKIMSEQFTKQFYNVEDFLDHSYGSLLDAEMSKQVKKAPVVEFQIPKHILLPQEAGADVEDSLLVKLWDFS